jgi:hypothetical protein
VRAGPHGSGRGPLRLRRVAGQTPACTITGEYRILAGLLAVASACPGATDSGSRCRFEVPSLRACKRLQNPLGSARFLAYMCCSRGTKRSVMVALASRGIRVTPRRSRRSVRGTEADLDLALRMTCPGDRPRGFTASRLCGRALNRDRGAEPACSRRHGKFGTGVKGRPPKRHPPVGNCSDLCQPNNEFGLPGTTAHSPTIGGREDNQFQSDATVSEGVVVTTT